MLAQGVEVVGEGLGGVALAPVPRVSGSTRVRVVARPPRSSRYAAARPGPPGTHTSGGPLPTAA